RIKVLLGNLVLTARLHQVYRCLIKILTGEGSLFKEFLPAVVNLLRSVQVLLRNLGIELRLLDFFGQARRGGRGISRLRLIVRTFGVLRGRFQITVLQYSEQLVFVNPATALHI